MYTPPTKRTGTTVGLPPCVLVVVTVFPVHVGLESIAVLKFGALVIVVGVPTMVLPAEFVTVTAPLDPALEPEVTDVKEVIDGVDAAVPLTPDSGNWDFVEINWDMGEDELI